MAHFRQFILFMSAVFAVCIFILISEGDCLIESDGGFPLDERLRNYQRQYRAGLAASRENLDDYGFEEDDDKRASHITEIEIRNRNGKMIEGRNGFTDDHPSQVHYPQHEFRRSMASNRHNQENHDNQDSISLNPAGFADIGEKYSGNHRRNIFRRLQGKGQIVSRQPTQSTLKRPNRAIKLKETDDKLAKVTIEVERLFDSLNKRRSEIEEPKKNSESGDEITVVIENDGEDDHDDQSVTSSKKSNIPDENESGFAIILDNTNGNEDVSTPRSTNDDFKKMSQSYDKMNAKFERFLSGEYNHIARANPSVPSHTTAGGAKQTRTTIQKPAKPTHRSLNMVRSTIQADIEKLKKLREKLEFESAAIDAQDEDNVKQLRSKVDQSQTEDGERVNSESKNSMGKKVNAGMNDDANLTNSHSIHEDDKESSSSHISLREGTRYYPTHVTATTRTASQAAVNGTSKGTKKPMPRVVHPRKASAMIEYLNKDPLESWSYKFQSLASLGLNSSMLRNGLVNAGSIDRLKNVMARALKGDDITLSIVGGSISAGGGLYKDEENIAGLYYKGVVDWWNKVITPLTGSEMKVNNIAIGSIGTDYFSYCLRSHISNDSNIIIWELSGNDYNRYLKTPTKGAKPLERLTRMALQVPSDPAIIFVNFFKGVDYKKTKKNCPNFEDQGEDIIAHYYKIPSLSWRAMVCEPLIDQNPLFTLKTLFCKDQYHPSLLAHAQTALLLILHLRHVMRSVLQYASSHDGHLPNFNSFYSLPAPLFVGLEHPIPLCWTLISPDFKESLTNNLEVRILNQNGFKIEYATNFPIRFDRVICWKAEKVGAVMKIQITLPEAQSKNMSVDDKTSDTRFEIAITTHTRFGGSAEIWLDQLSGQPMVLQEGRPNDTGKRTQVDVITQNAEPGVHTLNLRAITAGFCLASIMVS